MRLSGLRYLLLCVVTASLLSVEAYAAYDWKRVEGEHFIVYHTSDDAFARDVLNKAEGYYKRIALELGYPRYSEFWTWDKRVKIYIYPDKRSFLDATGQPEWSEGVADYTKKQIGSYRWSVGFTDSLLPHEMAHLIFRDFVGFKGEIPLWIDEGVAQWAEEPKRKEAMKVMRELYRQDKVLSLEYMMKLDMRTLSQKDRVFVSATRTKSGEQGVLFLSLDNMVHTYYVHSVSLIGFLIERYGSKRFSDFCRQLRDGKSLNDALRSAYPSDIRDIREFEDKWREYIAGSIEGERGETGGNVNEKYQRKRLYSN